MIVFFILVYFSSKRVHVHETPSLELLTVMTINQHVNLIITNWPQLTNADSNFLLAITDHVPLEVLPFRYKKFES